MPYKSIEKRRAKCKRYYDNNRNVILEKGAARQKTPNAKFNWLLWKYGITIEQWEAKFDAQGRCCGICRATTPGGDKGWHTDHCHLDGYFRGILCFRCNVGLGYFRDKAELLCSAADYLKNNLIIIIDNISK